MENKKIEVISEMFKNLYGEQGRRDINMLLTNIKSDLEKIPNVDTFVTARVKSPPSILAKCQGAPKYLKNWNTMKDLVGFMIVVDDNNDVDMVLEHFKRNFDKLRNPNSSSMIMDFRKINVRTGDTDLQQDYAELPSVKGYQTNDGYKNCRVNLMIPIDKNAAYPLEIQVKTKAQLAAHDATHEIYKSKVIPTQEDRIKLSDALFPYFEAMAHYKLNKGKMTERQILKCEDDIEAIYERNKDIYNKYPSVFIESCSIFAVSLFLLKHRERLYANHILDDSLINNQLIQSEILRIFRYKQKELRNENSNLTDSQAFKQTVDNVIDMPYDEFINLRNSIAGDFRKQTCVITGLFDMIRKSDIELIQRCTKSFKEVIVAVYDDDLARVFLGDDAIYSANDRLEGLSNIKGVSRAVLIGMDGAIKEISKIDTVFEPTKKPKKYKIGYIPGVFDGFHAGHIEHIKNALELCEELYVGVKSDYAAELKYRRKGDMTRSTMMKENERLFIANSIYGVTMAELTDNDVAPPDLRFRYMVSESKKGEPCAIFLGSDWMTEPEKKPAEARKFLEMVQREFPQIELVSSPRGNSGRSSTNFKKKKEQRTDIPPNPLSIITAGVN